MWLKKDGVNEFDGFFVEVEVEIEDGVSDQVLQVCCIGVWCFLGQQVGIYVGLYDQEWCCDGVKIDDYGWCQCGCVELVSVGQFDQQCCEGDVDQVVGGLVNDLFVCCWCGFVDGVMFEVVVMYVCDLVFDQVIVGWCDVEQWLMNDVL